MNIHHEVRNWCDEESCPTAPGAFTLKNVQNLPGITPHGNYEMQVCCTCVRGS